MLFSASLFLMHIKIYKKKLKYIENIIDDASKKKVLTFKVCNQQTSSVKIFFRHTRVWIILKKGWTCWSRADISLTFGSFKNYSTSHPNIIISFTWCGNLNVLDHHQGHHGDVMFDSHIQINIKCHVKKVSKIICWKDNPVNE